MLDIIYTIIIWPLVQIIELIFVIGIKIFRNPVISLILISFAISIITLPLYFIAEKFQKKERELQKLLKPKIDKIKSVFKGDEQYMILSTFYKQNNYHPIYALRNSFSLLVQIPFFIAAYSFISDLELFNGVSFLFIKDLGIADGLLKFGNININFLPFIMTFFNLSSGFIYSIELEKKDKIQILGIAIIFLILLYNSPASLVLYWTLNNIFSLLKNILQKNKYFINIIYKISLKKIFIDINLLKYQTLFFIISCLILFLLHGLIIPSSLIASSVHDFSYLGQNTTPFYFILITLLQSTGIFLFWIPLLYFLFSNRIKKVFLYLCIILTGISIVNIFLITENFGHLTASMIFSEPKSFIYAPIQSFINLIIILLVSITLFLIIYKNKIKIIMSFLIITIMSLLTLSLINIKNINNDYLLVKNKYESENIFTENYLNHYTFSKNGNNVLVILLDEFTGVYLPYIFEEKPNLKNTFNGFIWYPNTISFSNHTRAGIPPVYGGYEYTPAVINERDNISLIRKYQEAFLLMPKLFSNAGFNVLVTDPPFDISIMSNLTIYSDYPEIKSENLIGKYTTQWLRENNNIPIYNLTELLKNNLIRFSFFKSSPLILRLIIYDRGNWLTINRRTQDQYSINFINNYAFLDSLNKITTFKETGDTFTSIYSFLPHNSSAEILQVPDYKPVETVTYRGSGSFLNDKGFHSAVASLIMLEKWFNYLKENNVYDNTRIIIVSDHGRRNISNISEIITLPNNQNLSGYNPLLIIKDFNNLNDFTHSDEFMTNADTLFIALEDIIENSINPFTGNPIRIDKNNGIMLTTITTSRNKQHKKNKYNIRSNEWLHVKDNIFDISNWSNITLP